jgi:hypothetical protein
MELEPVDFHRQPRLTVGEVDPTGVAFVVIEVRLRRREWEPGAAQQPPESDLQGAVEGAASAAAILQNLAKVEDTAPTRSRELPVPAFHPIQLDQLAPPGVLHCHRQRKRFENGGQVHQSPGRARLRDASNDAPVLERELAPMDEHRGRARVTPQGRQHFRLG